MRIPKYYEVPNYEVKFGNDKNHDYCVVIFVINEGTKLLAQLERMSSIEIAADIVISDGGSTDGSTEISILKKNNVNTLLVKKDSGKLGSQMRIAFSWAMEKGYKGVIVIDGNNKDSVESIPEFINKLREGYDHVQGSRFIPGGKAINTPTSRMIGLKLIHIPVMRLASGYRFTDTTNGFRAYSSNLLLNNDVSLFRNIFNGYELHYYLAVRSIKVGLKCVEIPVIRRYPSKGKVPTKISPILGNIEVIKKLLLVALGFYNPK
ncbi:glycosyltransferase family 2 protein [Vibrio cholerae]|nr:glycosyltransferase family 2 protein [Vibrio cholerae]EGR4421118.1 glycosyltransferase family 2 protein [Vibrio cholerae]EGR4432018.1 glycosyltransferase family 2 protein [Vibrio cholerae]HAS5578462.1 glycosyltransferase family 2 protein [Vibrio cholerae]